MYVYIEWILSHPRQVYRHSLIGLNTSSNIVMCRIINLDDGITKKNSIKILDVTSKVTSQSEIFKYLTACIIE